MRKWLNNYFDFSKSEFNGLVVLAVLILGVTAAPYAYAQFAKDEYPKEDYLIVKRLILSSQTANTASQKTGKSLSSEAPFSPKKSKISLFRFDPNIATQSDWLRLGLSDKQAAAILKYVEKGGQFRRPEDLKKMYTISPDKYQELYPFVAITSAAPNQSVATHPYETAKANPVPSVTKRSYPAFPTTNPTNKLDVIVEINAADSAALDEIRGIGPAFATRILNYRKRIGGFHTKAQLMEVFGLDSLKYQEIRNQITVDANAIKKININTVTADQLKNHPYLRYKQVNALIQYRKQHGNYANIADLAKVVLIPAETIAQLAPYLTF